MSLACRDAHRWDELQMTETPHHHGYIHRKEEYLRRLRRIEGQARGLQRMVEEEKYCIDILTQISAITKALQSVGLGLLEEHQPVRGGCGRGGWAGSRREDEGGDRRHRQACPLLSRRRRASA